MSEVEMKRRAYYLRKIDQAHSFVQDCEQNIKELSAKGESTLEYERVIKEALTDLRYYINSYLAV